MPHASIARRRLVLLGVVCLALLGVGLAFSSLGRDVAEESAVPSEAPARVESAWAPLPDTPEARGEAMPRAGERWEAVWEPTGTPQGAGSRVLGGRVLDPEGRPVGGVDLRLEPDDGLPGDGGADGLLSEDDGSFLFEELAPRTFRILVQGPGSPPVRRVVTGLRPDRRDVRIRVPAAWHVDRLEEGWSARIRVLAPDGTPVPKWTYTEALPTGPGATIDGWVEPEPGEPGLVWYASDGPKSLVVHGCMDEELERLPYATAFVPDLVRDGPVREVRLRREVAIRGRVEPPGKRVRVVLHYLAQVDGRAEDPALAEEGAHPGAIRTAWQVTEVEGRFAFTELPPGRVRLVALPEGAEPSAATLGAGTTVATGTEDVTLRVTPCEPIRGVIDVGAAEKATEVEYVVRVTRRDGEVTRVVWERVLPAAGLAAAEGRFETAPLPTDAEYDVIVQARGNLTAFEGFGAEFAMRRIARVVPGGPEVFVVLQRLPTLTVRPVREDGIAATDDSEVLALSTAADPLVLAAWLAGDEALAEGVRPARPADPTRADPGPYEALPMMDGRHVFPALPVGDYVLWCVGFEGAAWRIEPPVPAGGEDVELVLRRTASRIHGRVQLPEGGLPPGFVLEARPAGGGPLTSVSTVRSDGWFELRGLAEGDWQILGHDVRDPRTPHCIFVPRLPAGDAPVALALATGRGISGIVLDGRGGPAAGATLRFEADAGERRVVTTDREGRFAVGGLVHGVFTLRVTLRDGRTRETTARAGSEDLRLLVE